jgi:hypothetical protein
MRFTILLYFALASLFAPRTRADAAAPAAGIDCADGRALYLCGRNRGYRIQLLAEGVRS